MPHSNFTNFIAKKSEIVSNFKTVNNFVILYIFNFKTLQRTHNSVTSKSVVTAIRVTVRDHIVIKCL